MATRAAMGTMLMGGYSEPRKHQALILFDRLSDLFTFPFWGSSSKTHYAIVRGSRSIRRAFKLRIAQSKSMFFGRTVVLMGAHCNLWIHAEMEGALQLFLIPKAFDDPDIPSFKGWTYPLQWLVQEGDDQEDMETLAAAAPIRANSKALERNVRQLCSLMAKYGGKYLDGTATQDSR